MKMNTLYAAVSGAFLLGAVTIASAQNLPSPAAKAVLPDKMENKTTGISSDESSARRIASRPMPRPRRNRASR